MQGLGCLLFCVSKERSQAEALLLPSASLQPSRGHSWFPTAPQRRFWWVSHIRLCVSLPVPPSAFPKRRTRGAACHSGCTSPWQTLSAPASPLLTTLGRGFTEPQALQPVFLSSACHCCLSREWQKERKRMRKTAPRGRERPAEELSAIEQHCWPARRSQD